MKWKFDPNQIVYVAEAGDDTIYRLKISGASIKEEDGEMKLFYSFENSSFNELPEESIMTAEEFLEVAKRWVDEDSGES